MFHGPHSLGALMGHGSYLVDDVHASRVVMLRDGKAVGGRVCYTVTSRCSTAPPSGSQWTASGYFGLCSWTDTSSSPCRVGCQAGSLRHAPGISLGLALHVGLRFRAGGLSSSFGPMPAGGASLARTAVTCSRTKVMGLWLSGTALPVVWRGRHCTHECLVCSV